MGWYSGNMFEQYVHAATGCTGPYAPTYLAADPLQRGHRRSCCGSKRVRHERPVCCSLIAIVVNIGMWLERFVIVVTSLHRDFLPSSWGMYYPTSGTGRRCSARSACSSP